MGLAIGIKLGSQPLKLGLLVAAIVSFLEVGRLYGASPLLHEGTRAREDMREPVELISRDRALFNDQVLLVHLGFVGPLIPLEHVALNGARLC